MGERPQHVGAELRVFVAVARAKHGFRQIHLIWIKSQIADMILE